MLEVDLSASTYREDIGSDVICSVKTLLIAAASVACGTSPWRLIRYLAGGVDDIDSGIAVSAILINYFKRGVHQRAGCVTLKLELEPVKVALRGKARITAAARIIVAPIGASQHGHRLQLLAFVC